MENPKMEYLKAFVYEENKKSEQHKAQNKVNAKKSFFVRDNIIKFPEIGLRMSLLM